MMPINRIYILIVLLGCLTASCIERYYPDMEAGSFSRIVVEALITDHDSIQQVRLSETSSLENTKILPLTGYRVSVRDMGDNEFMFHELKEQPGIYEGTIDESYLQTGNKFRLYFNTPAGEEYGSEFEELLPCPPVDSVYYEIKSVPTTDPDVDVDGAQFYIDFKGFDNYGRYYRWQIDETWEYHSTWPIRIYIDAGGFHNRYNDSLFCCYKTIPVDDLFILSTSGLVENIYKKYKLHFVNDHTQKLMHKYSLLIKQYSISKDAYSYWKALEQNNQESGGLFDYQPATTKGNIANIRNQGEVVLGYFGVSSVKTRRFIFSDFPGLRFRDVPWCRPRMLQPGELGTYGPEDWPVYLITYWDPIERDNVLGIANPECFDCTLLGGTTEKPSYWNEK